MAVYSRRIRETARSPQRFLPRDRAAVAVGGERAAAAGMDLDQSAPGDDILVIDHQRLGHVYMFASD